MQALAPKATEKQVAFLKKLIDEKDWTSSQLAAPVQMFLSGETVNRKKASDMIDQMMKLPSTKKPAAKVDVEEGFYVLGDQVWKVQKSLSSSGKYAKRLTENGNFVYVAGGVAKLANAEKLTLDKAKHLGKLYGMCMICGRTLTDENSIAQGIGPICADKF